MDLILLFDFYFENSALESCGAVGSSFPPIISLKVSAMIQLTYVNLQFHNGEISTKFP